MRSKTSLQSQPTQLNPFCVSFVFSLLCYLVSRITLLQLLTYDSIWRCLTLSYVTVWLSWELRLLKLLLELNATSQHPKILRFAAAISLHASCAKTHKTAATFFRLLRKLLQLLFLFVVFCTIKMQTHKENSISTKLSKLIALNLPRERRYAHWKRALQIYSTRLLAVRACAFKARTTARETINNCKRQ